MSREWADAPPTDAQVADRIIDADLSRTLLEATVYAIRTNDWLYLRRQYERHVETSE